MVGGDYSSWPRPCMGCSAWVDVVLVNSVVWLFMLFGRPNDICSNTRGFDWTSGNAFPKSAFSGAFTKFRGATIGLDMSVRPSAQNNSAPIGSISVKFNMNTFRKSVQRIQISLKSDKNDGHNKWRPIYVYDSIPLSSSTN
jgi:hypothetical protein